ncbi:hypothetical protein PIB30_054689 [Stylosanthes scabra]|uniref:Uncharacterized protein n=1 Tax=Stylosanthes scabra TaxID=79078 RepID=A0ABU6UHM9_9FABA|nr:hypothetical protein [Stylosanthes scabra]
MELPKRDALWNYQNGVQDRTAITGYKMELPKRGADETDTRRLVKAVEVESELLQKDWGNFRNKSTKVLQQVKTTRSKQNLIKRIGWQKRKDLTKKPWEGSTRLPRQLPRLLTRQGGGQHAGRIRVR